MEKLAELIFGDVRPISRDAVARVADRIFAVTGLKPGCDARLLARAMEFAVCPRLGRTEIIDGQTIYYDESLKRRERDVSIAREIAMYLLRMTGTATRANVLTLTLALTTKTSGVFRSTA